jgi:hypothetical protein
MLSLVPGGRPTLGYDGARFQPTAAQAASYAGSADAMGLPNLAEYLDAVTSPERQVELPAMLVAVGSLEPVASDVHHDDSKVRERILYGNDTYGLMVVRVGSDVVALDADQVATPLDDRSGAEHEAGLYDEAIARVTRLGLRLSTPDEWEYACGGAAATLWRWGDDIPDSGYPYDHRIGSHRELNLWGLAIGQDPYMHEWTAERTVVCGGDGGEITHHGAGEFLGWVTLATAYRNLAFGEWLNSEDGFVDDLLVRPILDLT